jgi:hypothetical protein
MKPSSRDQLGLASPLNYAAIQSTKTKTPLRRRRCEQGLDASHIAFRGEGREFFLDILFHRVSDVGTYRQLRGFHLESRAFALSTVPSPLQSAREQAISQLDVHEIGH